MKNKKWFILIIVGVLCISAAGALIIYNKYLDKRAGEKSKEIIDIIQNNILKPEISNIDNNLISIDGNEYIGILTIPTLELELPIMSDWSYKKMKISPCRYYGSIETDDLVICAHSYKNLFRYISNLKPKDIVIYTDINGVDYIYEVEVIEIIDPIEIKEMIESDFDLTLFTCTNDNQNRITVRLNKI